MKEKMTNNLPLKLLSVALAFLIWLAVLYVANPIETRRIRVNVEVLNEEVLTRKAKTYDAGDLSSVYVEFHVRKLDRDFFDASSFRATMDLSRIYDVTGAVPINVEVIKNQNLIEGDPIAVPSVVMVKVEGIMEKKFVLEANTSGEPASGHTIGVVEIEPKTVTLKGPESVIGRISSVGVDMNVSEADADLEGVAEIICYDANHNPLKIDYGTVIPDQKDVDYFVKILAGKSLSLEYEVSGEPAKGYKFVGAESTTKSIAVSGPNEAIENISGILIPKELLNVTGLTDNKTVRVNIEPYLPAGVVIEGSKYVDVVLKIEAKSTQSITLSQQNITITGKNSRFIYDIIPDDIMVNVSGLTADVDTINANSLGASINVGTLGEGDFPGSLTFNNPDNIEIDSHSPFTISVRSIQESTDSETILQSGSTQTTENPTPEPRTEESTPADNSIESTRAESTPAETE